MAKLIPQPSINDARTQALLALNGRLDSLDLTPILTNRIDSVSDSALIFLAWQWDMLSPEWQLMLGSSAGEDWDSLTDIDSLTDVDTLLSSGSGPTDFDSWRVLLKAAIPLHSVLGTPYALKQALAAMGWTNVTLLEGQASWGGSSWPANEGWAVFRVLVNLAAAQIVGTADAAQIIAAINFFKNERSWLDSVIFVAQPLADNAPVPIDFTGLVDTAPPPTDFAAAPATPLADTYSVSVKYNNRYQHVGHRKKPGPQPTAGPIDSGISVNGVVISGTVTGALP